PLQTYLDDLLEAGFGYRDVHWRLVWEDTRYCDGIIPDESEYFLDDAENNRITAFGGEISPHTGRWGTFIDGSLRYVHLKQGQKLPDYEDKEGKLHRALWSLLERDDKGNIFVNRQ
ncbi:Imm72 family immunity protein, partial [Rahnella sp. AA]|uniref:Imm72 family immunity protein n=1 Tax=Rahnella sp. AA TaxID=2057180 RepID=UPI002100D07B